MRKGSHKGTERGKIFFFPCAANELHIGDNLQKLFRRYCRNIAEGKVLSVSSNNIINGKPFPAFPIGFHRDQYHRLFGKKWQKARLNAGLPVHLHSGHFRLFGLYPPGLKQE
jgi:hypothetical protein